VSQDRTGAAVVWIKELFFLTTARFGHTGEEREGEIEKERQREGDRLREER
jgi:hypothetical protein